MHKRILDLSTILARKSVFLFGPRQTGKSTWLKKYYPEALYINLLSKKVFDDYANRSGALESDIKLFRRKSQNKVIVIDEVQKLPSLLDEVHNQIELDKSLRFILTGSSARKLKRKGANLLGGRASWRNMFPLVYPEIKTEFETIADLEKRLLVGGLPSIYDSEAPFEDLDDYVQLYLNEEIKAEGLVRNYEAFGRFLFAASLVNGEQVNFTALGNDSQIPPRTIHDYFEILEDTLIGFMLPAFTKTPTRKAVASAKFYLFDTGIGNALLNRQTLKAGTPEFGHLFEQFIVSEIKAYVSYKNTKHKLSYWRSTSQFEVDLILEKQIGATNEIICIEVKAKKQLSPKDFKGIKAFTEDYPDAKKIIVKLEGRHAIENNNIESIPVFEFLDMLWSGNLI